MSDNKQSGGKFSKIISPEAHNVARAMSIDLVASLRTSNLTTLL